MTMIHEVAQRPRQIVLGILGVMHLAMSGAIYGQPVFSLDDSSLWHLQVPIHIRGTLWGVIGLFAIVGSFSKHRLQMFGFIAATIMPMERTLSYLWSWFMWIIPGEPGGYSSSVWEAMWWGSFVVLVIWSSGLSKSVVIHDSITPMDN